MNDIKTILVTGGAGYVGAVLTPRLLAAGYHVKVYDLFWYGENVFDTLEDKSNLTLIKGDIRDIGLLQESIKGCDAVIHLACISNDPSFELDPALGKSINYDAFEPLVKISKSAGVKRFIYASSSSVYGIKEEEQVTEDLTLEPLTDYSKYKADCEKILNQYGDDHFVTVTVRPSTVCGYSPRLRLDLIVNILTNHAITNRTIRIFGGSQYRPNIHIHDMVDFYLLLLKADPERIRGQIFNAGYENFTVTELAHMVKSVIGEDVVLETVPTDDNRSYRVSSNRAKRILGFEPKHTIADAVTELQQAFSAGLVPDSMTSNRYFNIKLMQKEKLA